MFRDRRVTKRDVVRWENLLINGGAAGETKHIVLAGQIAVGRRENGLKQRRPIVGRQIRVCNCDWHFCSAGPGSQCFNLCNCGLHRQKRILPLRGAVIGYPELTADLREIDLVDRFNHEGQSVGICFPLRVRMLVIKTVAEHVLFTARHRRILVLLVHNARIICINGLNVTPDDSLWTGTGSIMNQRLAPTYDSVAWQSPEIGNSFGRFVATSIRNGADVVFSSAQHAVVGLNITPPATPTPTPNPRVSPRPRPTPAPRPTSPR
jgi:hypothetical protein